MQFRHVNSATKMCLNNALIQKEMFLPDIMLTVPAEINSDMGIIIKLRDTVVICMTIAQANHLHEIQGIAR